MPTELRFLYYTDGRNTQNAELYFYYYFILNRI